MDLDDSIRNKILDCNKETFYYRSDNFFLDGYAFLEFKVY